MIEMTMDAVRAAHWPELDPNLERFRKGHARHFNFAWGDVIVDFQQQLHAPELLQVNGRGLGTLDEHGTQATCPIHYLRTITDSTAVRAGLRVMAKLIEAC
jgi:hypothetical protein